MSTESNNVDLMIQIYDELVEKLTHKFGQIEKNQEQRANLLCVASEISMYIEMNDNGSPKEYEPNLVDLMVETMLQHKQIFTFTKKTVALTSYINDYADFYYEEVENALPINKVGDIDGNDMFINSYIDENFGYFNE